MSVRAIRWLPILVLAAAACGGEDDATEEDTSTTDVALDADSLRVVFDDGGDGFTYAVAGGTISLQEGDAFDLIPADGDPVHCGAPIRQPDDVECHSYREDSLLAIESLRVRYLVEAFADPGDRVGDEESATIAGRAATCALVDPSAALINAAQTFSGRGASEGDTRVCLDDATGLLLSWSVPGTSGEAGDEIVLTATAVTAPTDADFEPPQPVIDGTDIDDDDIEFPDETVGM